MPRLIAPFEETFGTAKPNLVVVRAGASSLHQNWLAMPYENRSWDMIVSYFDEDAYKLHTPQKGVQAVLVKGGKWDGLFETFMGFPEHEGYAHIWLPDDDIATTGDAINAIFLEASTYGLAVCQPSLTLNSYFTHFLFMNCAGFRLRYTNYVEIMVPCLEQSLFREVLPLFEDTMSGFGLDYLWCRFPQSGPFRAAVLDSIAVHHTRPIGSQLKRNMKARGGRHSVEQEEHDLVARFGPMRKPVPLAYAGVNAAGHPVTGRSAMAVKMALSYWRARKEFLDPRLARRKSFQIFKRQLIKHLTLEPLVP